MRFVRDLIERRIFRFLVAYCAGAWAGLELIDQLVGNELLPPIVYRAVLSLAICGLPGALIVSWFHGAKGKQDVPAIERWLLAGVVVFALGTTGFVVADGSRAVAGEASGSLTPLQDPSRVAVLYMDARGGEDAQFLGLGLTEALIDQLGAVDGLHVVSRNGAQLFRGSTAPADSIGRTLQVGSLVGGTVALAGDRVRVDIALTSATTGEQIASHRLERPRTEIFALQDELADTVAVFLRRAIGKELGSRLMRASTRSTQAWELAQQAAALVESAASLASSGDVDAASRALENADGLLAQAEAADPQWVEPVVRRGWVAYRQTRLGGVDRTHNQEWIARGLEHATRALTVAPRDAGALELRATLIYWRRLLNLTPPEELDRSLSDAEAGFRAAIAASGGRSASARNSLSHLLINKGDNTEAKLQANEAYRRDPFLENPHLTIWRIFTAAWGLEDLVEAERYCAEGMRRFPDEFRFKQCQLMLPALGAKRPELARAWELLDEFEAAAPPAVREVNRRRGMMYISMALARAGMRDSAMAVARNARGGADIDPLRELAHLESITLTWLGEVDEAVRQLSVYLSANPTVLESMRAEAARNELPWYHRALLKEPAFRSLVGLQ